MGPAVHRQERAVVVVAGGPLWPGSPVPPAGGSPTGRSPSPPGPTELPAGAWVVAADAGLERAQALGLRVDLVVGDLDSVSAEALDTAVAAGTAVERHPAAKDATDLDLALAAALRRRPERLVVVGSHLGRLDHLLAIAATLTAPAVAGVAVEAHLGPARMVVVRPGPASRLAGEPGELASLLPMHGPARGVTTEGLLYPLRDEDLPPGSTRGLSNELVAPEASVSLRAGVLAAVLPGEAGTHWRGAAGAGT